MTFKHEESVLNMFNPKPKWSDRALFRVVKHTDQDLYSYELVVDGKTILESSHKYDDKHQVKIEVEWLLQVLGFNLTLDIEKVNF